jgi:hypothetical protein
MCTKRTVRVAYAAALGWLMCVTIGAQPADDRTIFTFNSPVELPGIALPPGKYLFRLADDNTRDVVSVLSADGKKVYGTFLTLRDSRLNPPSAPEVRFMEAPQGAPLPIRSWWYIGDSTGWEFIYPKEQARRLAKAANEPVLTTQDETKEVKDTHTSRLARINAKGESTNINSGDKPAPQEPAGTRVGGEVASMTIVIVTHPRQ